MLGQKILLTISNLRIALFGATNVVKNSDKEKYVYNASGITFDWGGSWRFGNDFTRNVVIFDADNSSSFFFFFSIRVFFHENSRFTGQLWKGEGIYLTPLYHFHPLHSHRDISRAFTAETSPLHIAGSRT